MSITTADVVICGAGVSGATTAYQLAVKQGVENIIMVDPLPPLSMTSDKSMECYRNWWPGPDDAMVSLMNRSIDTLEQLHQEAPDRLHMHRRGYLYATSDPNKVAGMIAGAEESTELGAGPLRIYRGDADDPQYMPVSDHGLMDAPTGADIFLEQSMIQEHFPYLTQRTIATLHARRCGWFAARQFGMYMLEQALEHGVKLVNGEVEAVVIQDGQVHAVKVSSPQGSRIISTNVFVNAAGPLLTRVGKMLDVEIPTYSELHLKMSINDSQQVIPRDMPLLIWNDPVYLPWIEEEKDVLAESEETSWLLEEIPVGVHGRPEGKGDSILLQWGYHARPVEPTFPIPIDAQYPEIVLRGMATVVPGLTTYINRIPKPYVDGGYYTRTAENRPLIGPLPVEGAYILGGVGGFGMQVSCGASELLATYITQSDLPHFAAAFRIDRYDDPEYQTLLERWGTSGQI